MTHRIGRSFEAMYPRANVAGVQLRYERRRFRVDGIRTEPVQAITLEMDPAVRREGKLLICWDHDKQEERHFYEGSLKEVREIEPPAELVGWQVICGPRVVDPYCGTIDEAEAAMKGCRDGSGGRKNPMILPIHLPNLAGNVYRETA